MNGRYSTKDHIDTMRRETREDLRLLGDRMDQGFEKVTTALSEHVLQDTTKFGDVDKRLSAVEDTRKTARWVVGVGLVALAGAAAEFFFMHLLQP